MQLQTLMPDRIKIVGIASQLEFEKEHPSTTQYNRRNLRSLAEAIILQAMEDLYDPIFKNESLSFFNGSGFKLCAEIAGLTQSECARVIDLLKKTIG